MSDFDRRRGAGSDDFAGDFSSDFGDEEFTGSDDGFDSWDDDVLARAQAVQKQKSPLARMIPWFAAGAVVAGGLVYFVSSGDGKDSVTLPSPIAATSGEPSGGATVDGSNGMAPPVEFRGEDAREVADAPTSVEDMDAPDFASEGGLADFAMDSAAVDSGETGAGSGLSQFDQSDADMSNSPVEIAQVDDADPAWGGADDLRGEEVELESSLPADGRVLEDEPVALDQTPDYTVSGLQNETGSVGGDSAAALSSGGRSGEQQEEPAGMSSQSVAREEALALATSTGRSDDDSVHIPDLSSDSGVDITGGYMASSSPPPEDQVVEETSLVDGASVDGSSAGGADSSRDAAALEGESADASLTQTPDEDPLRSVSATEKAGETRSSYDDSSDLLSETGGAADSSSSRTSSMAYIPDADGNVVSLSSQSQDAYNPLKQDDAGLENHTVDSPAASDPVDQGPQDAAELPETTRPSQVVDLTQSLDLPSGEGKEVAEQLAEMEAQLRVLSKLVDEMEAGSDKHVAQRKVETVQREVNRLQSASQREQAAESRSAVSSSSRGTQARTSSTGSSSTSTRRAASSTRSRATASVRWELRAAVPGEAWISRQGRQELRHVKAGDYVPGHGRVARISQENGQWVVRTSSGAIRP